MNERELLESARERIESCGWQQGAYGDDVDGYCVLGAVRAAHCQSHNWLVAEYRAATERLMRHLPDVGWTGSPDFPDDHWAQKSIPSFNDDENTTKADVLALFDKAIADEF